MRNRFFSLTLGALLAIGTAGAALAQDNATAPPPDQGQGRGPGRMNPDRQLERMTRELNLTTDQQNQIKPLLVERNQKMQEVFQNQSLSESDRRTQMRTIAEGTRTSIRNLLTDDQKQKFDAMRDHMRRGGPGGGAPEGSAPQPQQ